MVELTETCYSRKGPRDEFSRVERRRAVCGSGWRKRRKRHRQNGRQRAITLAERCHAGVTLQTLIFAGGMLDVILRRVTSASRDVTEKARIAPPSHLERLGPADLLEPHDYQSLNRGYELLRLRRSPPATHRRKVAALHQRITPCIKELPETCLQTPADLSETLHERMRAIRRSLDRITS